MSVPSTIEGGFFGALGQFWSTFIGLLNTWPINWIFAAFGITLAILIGAGIGIEIVLRWFNWKHPQEAQAFRVLGEIGKSDEDFDAKRFLFKGASKRKPEDET